MAVRKELSRENVFYAIENGEFGEDVIASNDVVAIVMTQDWCPFWAKTREWMDAMEDNPRLDIYELIYNKVEYFDVFLDFKENHFKNKTIPYIRLYRKGKFIKDVNVVSEQEFIEILGL